MRVIIVHTLDQAMEALEAAVECNKEVILQSAHDAIFYAGSLYLLHMFKQAKQQYPQAKACFILDCADAGAEAVAAMQLGHTTIRSSAKPELRAKLADIARQLNVEMVDAPFEALNLDPERSGKTACKEWIEKLYETS